MRLLCGRLPLTWHKGRGSALLDQVFRVGLHKPCWSCLELARDSCSEQDARLQEFLLDGISVTAPGHREEHHRSWHQTTTTGNANSSPLRQAGHQAILGSVAPFLSCQGTPLPRSATVWVCSSLYSRGRPEEHSWIVSSQQGSEVLVFCSALSKAHIQVVLGEFSLKMTIFLALPAWLLRLLLNVTADATKPTILPPVHAGTCLREESVLFKLA